jgi:hypothetical protein
MFAASNESEEPTMESYEAANRRELATVETFMG